MKNLSGKILVRCYLNESINQFFTAMRRIIFSALLLAAISTASFAREYVVGGKTHTTLGDYKIEIADNPVTINGEDFKAFVISYQNSPLELTVVIRKGKKCKNFLVLSDKLSVQYVCNENYFGVEKLDKTMAIDGFSTSEEALNRSEYFHQKVICSGNGSEIEHTQLIAAYFPMLINSNDKVLASL